MNVDDGAWSKVRINFARINKNLLGPASTPTFGSITLTGALVVAGDLTMSGLTASRLVWTDASKNLASKDLFDLIAGTANRVTVADDGDGSVTLSAPQDIHTGASPTFSGLTIQVAGASDATQSFITATNQVDVYVDESAHNDIFIIEGQTAARSTNVHIISIDGSNAVLRLYSGSNSSILYKAGSDDSTVLANYTQDADIIFSIDDGGVTKYISWDADVDKLKHSAGLFDFDNDDIATTGTIDGSAGEVLTEDNDAVAPTGKDDGYIGVAIIGGQSRVYFAVDGIMYYIDGTVATVPVTGNPIGLLLALTYNLE